MIYGYIRVSTHEQNIESQKNVISRYCMEHKLIVDEWIELEISSRKSTEQRGITELLQKLSPNDIVIASELSRLGRSIKETLNIVEEITHDKHSRFILIKQNLDLNPQDKKNIINKVMITVFAMVAELERDFISERTKEGLKARVAKGIRLGKPKGTLQKSMYDNDQNKIFDLHKLGVPLHKIIATHLGYGKYWSLKKYLEKRYSEKNTIPQ